MIAPAALCAPLSVRPWTQAEQMTSLFTMTGLTVAVCVALALSMRRPAPATT